MLSNAESKEGLDKVLGYSGLFIYNLLYLAGANGWDTAKKTGYGDNYGDGQQIQNGIDTYNENHKTSSK